MAHTPCPLLDPPAPAARVGLQNWTALPPVPLTSLVLSGKYLSTPGVAKGLPAYLRSLDPDEINNIYVVGVPGGG